MKPYHNISLCNIENPGFAFILRTIISRPIINMSVLCEPINCILLSQLVKFIFDGIYTVISREKHEDKINFSTQQM